MNNLDKRIPFFRYFPKSIKFYDLKSEKIAAGVFIILLIVNFCASILITKYTENVSMDDSQLLTQVIFNNLETILKAGIISGISTFLMTIFSSFYMFAFIRDLRGIPYTVKGCLKYTFSKLFHFIVLTILVTLSVSIGYAFLYIPGIIIYVMFIFASQFMLDQDKSIFNSLKASINLTKGYKMGIFIAVLIFKLLIYIFPTFVEAQNGLLVFSFVSAFILTIFSIIFLRFVTLIYYDLEYIRKPRNIDVNV